MWLIEDIQDPDYLYIRVHKDFVSGQDKLPKNTAFKNTPEKGDNLSSDWSKYSTPESSRNLIGKQKKKSGEFKDPLTFYIWKFSVIALRMLEISPQKAIHDLIFNDPELDGIPNNRAHSLIIGAKPVNRAEFQKLLLRAGEWAIAPESFMI